VNSHGTVHDEKYFLLQNRIKIRSNPKKNEEKKRKLMKKKMMMMMMMLVMVGGENDDEGYKGSKVLRLSYNEKI